MTACPPATALVVGATGLVGGHLVRLLSGSGAYGTVRVVARRPLMDPPPGIDQRIVSFDQLDEHAGELAGDHVFCALGTTRKAAGSAARFREVDLEYPRAIATHARRNGARHFCLISAIGANPRSRFLYNRVKGEVEAAVRAAGYPGGTILRPSVLGGTRGGRPLEHVAQVLMSVVPGRWRTVDAADVARAAILVAAAEEPGWRVLESDEIRRLARSSQS